MDKKRIVASVVVFFILAFLVYLQYRHWRTFDWTTFWSQTGRVNKLDVLGGIALVYFAYWLRAVRWKIFLRRVRPQTKTSELVSPTLTGFSGLALLGRAGEFIRPYLIARRTGLTFSSQLAVWAIERAFDVGSVAILMLAAIVQASGIPRALQPAWYSKLFIGAYFLSALTVGMAAAAIVVRWRGERVAQWIEERFAHRKELGHSLAMKVREFKDGLNTIHGVGSFVWLTVVSVGMWCVIAFSYAAVTRSYNDPSLNIGPLQILILMGSSMAGSMLQLPAVGGGSQMATIAALSGLFAVRPELAASCGILLWLVTFASVVPSGMLLAQHERLSLRKLSEESHRAE
jgi:uncharacterized protein (TIRG00374 family)